MVRKKVVKRRKARKPSETRLVMSVPEAGKLLDLSRDAAYAAAKKGQIPTIRIGNLLKVPCVRFEKMLAGE